MEKAKQIPYRAIALDLDGTLTNHEKVVTPKTREALLKAASEGAVIILASGRPTYGIEPVAESLELNQRGGYILSYNGGNIVNAQTGEKLFSQFLPDEVIPELYAYAKEKGHALLGYAGNEIITEMPDDEYVKEESRINKMNIRKVDNLFEALEPHPTKLLMTGDPTLMLKAEEELVEKLGDRMDIFRSAPFFLELVPKGIDKAKSLTRLLAKINLTPADLIAFGDGYNDLSMLKLAGMGVAMENAARNSMKGIITCTRDQVVSSDLTGFPQTCIFDETAGIMLDDDFVKLIAWYDNEWGYTNKLLDLIAHMHEVDSRG